MPGDTLTVALIHDVFYGESREQRLADALAAARQAGAELAALPELPLDSWPAATRTPRDEDAEDPGGPRHRIMAQAAKSTGIALLGGAITKDAGRRFNRGLLFDAAGRWVAGYDKLHLPSEEGFWESDHYEPGDSPPQRIDALGFPLGLQLCSDLNRPDGCQLLGALGAAAIFGPRATPPSSYPRWLTVIRANALTSASYVLSINRPRPECGVEFGGPSVAVAPDGQVLVETTDALSLVTLDRAAVARARADYPGYLPRRPDLFARAWSAVSREAKPDA